MGVDPGTITRSRRRFSFKAVETIVVVGNLKPRHKFRWHEAVCYNSVVPGLAGLVLVVAGGTEVTWLDERSHFQRSKDVATREDKCLCGTKLVADSVSGVYGKYCPNENCSECTGSE